MATTNQSRGGDDWNIFWVIMGAMFVLAVILNVTLGPGDSAARDARDYAELREHDQAKAMGHAMYLYDKEHGGR